MKGIDMSTCNRRKFLLALALSPVCFMDTVYAANARPSSDGASKIMLGDGGSFVQLKVSGRGSRVFVSLHENESTSVSAARAVGKSGKLIRLVQSGERNISFSHKGKKYIADPNRIFSPSGRKRTLANLSKSSPEAEKILAELAAKILATIGRPSMVIALHNNTDGGGLSIATYAKAKSGVKKVYVSKKRDPDDFFLVTQSAHFENLKANDFNVALESSGALDDGSLSRYFGGRGVPYINVETQNGHLKEYKEMLRVVP